MKTKRLRKRLFGGISFVVLLALTLAAGDAWASPPHRTEGSRGHGRNGGWEQSRHDDGRHGAVVSRLPQGHRTVWVGRSRYYYGHGAFYRRGPSGYIVVGAPVGAVVLDLPFGFHAAVIGGSTYYTYGGAYYRRVPSGYVVVNPPPQVVVREPTNVIDSTGFDEEVSVISDRLNLRSGPSTDYPVVSEVLEGTTLIIKGNAEGWWYVELPDGRHGWVMRDYTTSPFTERASG